MEPRVSPIFAPEVVPNSTMPRAARASVTLFILLLLAGCASTSPVTKVMDKALQAVGIQEKPPEMPVGERSMDVRLFPGDNLNAGNDARPLALVARVYQLRGPQRFEQAPFDAFLDESREKAALGDDLISVNEVVLLPGKMQALHERLSADAGALGVVALFRAPAAERWRLTFDARHKSINQGITLGVHACAMTTTSPALITPLSDDPGSLVSARCQSTSP